MRFVKCLALSAVVFGILSVHVQAAVPVSSPPRKAMQKLDQPAVAPDPAAMATACPATNQGTLVSGGVAGTGGSWSGDTTGLSDDFDDDYPAACSYGGGQGGADEIHTFQVDTAGVWSFDTSMACWDTSLGLRVDGGGGCPGDAVACDGDGLSDCYFESSLTVFLVTGTDYFMVVDGWVSGQEGPYNVNWVLDVVACTSDADCSDGDPCNGDETCNVANGQCSDGTPPCDRAQACTANPLRNGVTCTDPDGCLIYENAQIGGWSDLGGDTEGTLIADDWEFATGDLGRNLVSYSTTAVGTAGPFIVATTIWGHGLNCVGGASQGNDGECDTDADCTGLVCVGGFNSGLPCANVNPNCPGICDTTGVCSISFTVCSVDGDCPGVETCNDRPCFADGDCEAGETCDVATCPADGTCQDTGFFAPGECSTAGTPCQSDGDCPAGETCEGRDRQKPGRGEIPGTLCVFVNIPSGYYTTLNCTPAAGPVMPTDGAWQVMGFVQTGGSAGPALAGQLPEIGNSTDVFGFDIGFANGAGWSRYWFGGGNLANWTGDMCTEALGACCTALGGTCTIETEADCLAAGSIYIGDNNAVNQFDITLDTDGDGVVDVGDACPNNAEFAADTGPCNCSSDDADGDDPGDNSCLDCNDACPNEATFCADTGPCNCSTSDVDGDGTLDCVDACPSNPDFAADQGPCNCSSADADGDGTLDCVDGCVDDPNKIAGGICGCGVDDSADEDGDGVPDCIDQCNGVDDAVFAPECVGQIPTVSEWGLVILALLLLAAGKVYFGRKSATA